MTWLKKVHTVQVGDIHASVEGDEQMEREMGMSKQLSWRLINMLKAQFPGNSIITWTQTRARLTFYLFIYFFGGGFVFELIKHVGYKTSPLVHFLSPLIGRRTIWAIFLNMHSEKTNIHSADVLKRKQSFCPVGERLSHFTTVHKSADTNAHSYSSKWN